MATNNERKEIRKTTIIFVEWVLILIFVVFVIGPLLALLLGTSLRLFHWAYGR